MNLLRVSSSPHLYREDSTRVLMCDVLIALTPALIWAVYYFGFRVLTICAVAVGSAVLYEYLYEKILKKPVTVMDCSAMVTGLLFAFTLPSTISLFIVALGTFFAIVVVKQLFGGLGKNIVNPALAARIFVFISFPTELTTYTLPGERLSLFAGSGAAADAICTATPLAAMQSGLMPGESVMNMLFGNMPGCIGEVSALLLLGGGIYLAVRRVIDVRIPLSCLAAVAAVSFLLPQNNTDALDFMLAQLLSGGLVLGAVFMATDYVTSPVTKNGRLIYGALIGLLTVFIRYFGGYPEGVSFAILIMNLFVYYLDRYLQPKPFGKGGGARAKAEKAIAGKEETGGAKAPGKD